MAEERVPPGLDPDVLHRVVTIEADTEHIGKMLHQASSRHFTYHSDEPDTLGGDDEHPAPLDYLCAAIGL